MGVVNPNKVTFAANTALYWKKPSDPEGAYANLGLLGDTASLRFAVNYRRKKDMYPEVDVAVAVQSYEASMEATLREWRRDVVALGLGMWPEDVPVTPGGDVTVTDEATTFNADDIAALAHPAKPGETIIVTSDDGGTTYSEGTDYLVIPRDLEGRTLLYRLSGGSIPAGATVLVDYTYTAGDRFEVTLGGTQQIRVVSLKLVEQMTNGDTRIAIIPRAIISIRDSLPFREAEAGGDLPITVTALYDPTAGGIVKVITEEA